MVEDGAIVGLPFTELGRGSRFEPYLHGRVFAEIRNDPAVFASVKVDPDAGTIV
ncbi:MAG TPA: hypothetical protein VE623_24480 [Acidimicrobiales bacterium]|nr:hypothetical protein [Acidimicrobiales bacterium]